MKKRYCIFSAQFLPHMGGVERYTYNLAKKLVERDNEVVVVTSMSDNLKDYEIMEGICVYRVPCINLLGGRYPLLVLNKRLRDINRSLKHYRFDLVIVNTRFYIHSLYGMVFAKRQDIPCITIEHGTSHLSVHNMFLDKIGALYEHVLTKIDCFFCKDYYGVSEACNVWLMHFNIKAKGVLYNSIDVDEIDRMIKEITPFYRKRYHIPEEAIVVVFTGRLLKEKGLPSLLNVMDKMHNEGKNIYLFIAGDGDMEEEIAERQTDYIIPLGRIDFIHIVTLLSEGDIFCLPSFSEGFSTSILEAAACRCYVLTTERGGAKELILDDEYGSVIPNNKEETLHDAFEKILNQPEKCKHAVQLTYNRTKICFNWNIVAEQVEKICRGDTDRKAI